MFIDNLTALTNYDITKIAKELNIKNFRGVFMRDTLPSKINELECGIVNLDSSNNSGTHWVCYYKNKDTSYYFDSFGLDPPEEIIKYLKYKKDKIIESSTFQIQEFNTHHCGYYCLLVIKLLQTHDFKEVVLSLI